MATITIPTRSVDFTLLPYEISARIGTSEMTITSLSPRSASQMTADIAALPDYTPPAEQARIDIARELPALNNLIASLTALPESKLLARIVKSLLEKDGLA